MPRMRHFSHAGLACVDRCNGDDIDNYEADEEEYNLSTGVDVLTINIGDSALGLYSEKANECRRRAPRFSRAQTGYTPDTHYVYFATLEEEGLVKIGASHNPEKRVVQLQSKFARFGNVMLRGYYECAIQRCIFRHPKRIRTACSLEEHYFEKYIEHRIHRNSEWFRDRGDVSAVITALMREGNTSYDQSS
jgi:hypothetical protein